MRIFLTLKLAAATLLIVFSHMVMAQTGYPELGQSIIVENRAGAGG